MPPHSYRFANEDHTLILRDGVLFAWDVARRCPRGAPPEWFADGCPTPAPFIDQRAEKAAAIERRLAEIDELLTKKKSLSAPEPQVDDHDRKRRREM